MKKNAFTLIELLAVIVILAIIALIATPIVLDIIDDTKRSAQLRSAENYLKAVEQSVAKKMMEDATFKPVECNITEEGNLDCNGASVEIKVSGEKPKEGSISLNEGIIDTIKLKYENEKTIIYGENKELMYDEYKESSPYQEKENIEIPDLYNNTLTPVTYDGNNWKVADVTEKWYDYSKQEWANAVILNKDSNKKVGDPITVDGDNPDALAMLVWIPRYEYKIEGTYGKGGTSTTNLGEIEVNFINKNIKEASNTYTIHPAFNFGGTDISGIWVGKFELSHTTKTNSLGCTTETCSESNNLRIIPNKSSLRSNTVSSFFYAIKSMNKSENTFGIDNSITDTHMMKNSEWGAAAYLSQSKYGKYGNSSYTGTNKEIYQNKSSNYITGNSNGTPSQSTTNTQCNYNDIIDRENGIGSCGGGASTTGNIYGVYDMSGGAHEYVMGVFANSDGYKWSGSSSTGNSGFAGKLGTNGVDYEGLEWPNEKYYEIYKASSGTTIDKNKACNGGICYGHALSETANWYQDYTLFVGSSAPWFVRGGNCNSGANAGVFASSTNYGNASGNFSARVVFSSTT